MAAGDVTIFDSFREDLGNGVHNLSTDTIKVALLKSAATPTKSIAGAKYSTYSANESASGGNYSTTGTALANIDFDLDSGRVVVIADKFRIEQDALNPTDTAWALIYNSTASNGEAIAFVDLGGTKDLSTTSIELRWNSVDGNGEIFKI